VRLRLLGLVAAVPVAAGLTALGGGPGALSAGASAIKVPCAPTGAPAGVVSAVVGTANSQLGIVETLVNKAHLAPGGSGTVSTTGPGGSVEQGMLTLSGDGTTTTLALALAPSSAGPFSSVGGGTFTKTVSGAVVTAQLDGFSWNYSVATAVATKLKHQGSITFTYTQVMDPSHPAPGISRVTTGTFTDYEPSSTDKHGLQSGSFTVTDDPGVGMVFQASDSIATACKHATAPTTTQEVERAYGANAGSTNLRIDYEADGGVVAPGDHQAAVTCNAHVPARGSYSLNKLEDAITGATIQAQQSGSNSGSSPACDPVFGAVPSPTDPTTDYDFGSTPTFPGEWS